MALELVNPWMLWGMAAVAVPVLIHLLWRATQRPIWFPTIEFVRRTMARQSRLARLRHLLLLLLRMLVVALLAAAFLKPVLKLPFQKLVRQQARRTAVIALDTSLSMGYTGSGATPLSRAKAEVEKILRSLRRSDKANVLFVSASVTSALPQATADVGLLRDELEYAEATMEEADFSAALEVAAEEFAASDDASQRELYLVSDFQRTNWAAVKLSDVSPDVNLYLVDVDSETKQNTAITEVRVRPASPRLGDEIELACEVTNFSRSPREVPVDLEVDGAQASTRRVLAPAYGSATAAFRATFEQVGYHKAVARIPSDGLMADNACHLVMDVKKALSVFLLTDESPDDSTTSAFYLVRALTPQRHLEGGIKARVVNGRQAAATDLRTADIVLVSNLYELTRPAAGRLYDYLDGGGCVLYFLGRGQAEAQLALLNSVAQPGPVAPFAVSDLLDLEGMGRGYVAWTHARYESPMLELFRDPAHGDLSRLQFRKFRLVTAVDPQAELLLEYEDGTAAAARQHVGAGAFVLCNFSPDPEFSDMVTQPIFPPLLHEMLQGALAEEAAPAGSHVGEVASVAIESAPEAPGFSFTGPGGGAIDARWQRVGDQITVLFDRTPAPGFYAVHIGGREVASTAVNVSPEESDLRELDGAELAAKQHIARRSYTVHTDVDPTYVERLRNGRELWPTLLVLALCVAAIEQTLAYLLRTR